MLKKEQGPCLVTWAARDYLPSRGDIVPSLDALQSRDKVVLQVTSTFPSPGALTYRECLRAHAHRVLDLLTKLDAEAAAKLAPEGSPSAA